MSSLVLLEFITSTKTSNMLALFFSFVLNLNKVCLVVLKMLLRNIFNSRPSGRRCNVSSAVLSTRQLLKQCQQSLNLSPMRWQWHFVIFKELKVNLPHLEPNPLQCFLFQRCQGHRGRTDAIIHYIPEPRTQLVQGYYAGFVRVVRILKFLSELQADFELVKVILILPREGTRV